jgi:excisionase family DNA binding protein
MHGMEKLLLRPVEAAEAIGIGRSKVYELLASGELPSIRIGSSIRVPLDQLRSWIARPRLYGRQILRRANELNESDKRLANASSATENASELNGMPCHGA